MDDRRTIILTRRLRLSSEVGTFGCLDTGTFKCMTVERPRPGLINDHPCIPATERGYDMDWTVGVHPKHPEVYEIQVPGRTAILVHSANVMEQLLGCIAPGRAVGHIELEIDGKPISHDGVTDSRNTLADLIKDLDKKPCRLIVKEA